MPEIKEKMTIIIDHDDKEFETEILFSDDDRIYFDKIKITRKTDSGNREFELGIEQFEPGEYLAEGYIYEHTASGNYEKRVGNGAGGLREACEEFFSVTKKINEKPAPNGSTECSTAGRVTVDEPSVRDQVFLAQIEEYKKLYKDMLEECRGLVIENHNLEKELNKLQDNADVDKVEYYRLKFSEAESDKKESLKELADLRVDLDTAKEKKMMAEHVAANLQAALNISRETAEENARSCKDLLSQYKDLEEKNQKLERIDRKTQERLGELVKENSKLRNTLRKVRAAYQGLKGIKELALDGLHAPQSYISESGLVQVPDRIRILLGAEKGAGVTFFEDKNKQGHVYMVSDGTFCSEYLGEPEENDNPEPPTSFLE